MGQEPKEHFQHPSVTRLAGESFYQKIDPSIDRSTGNQEESTGFHVEASPKLELEFIGRYRVIRHLGDGGLGRVYLASDGVLPRNVAIKIPHRHLVSSQCDMEVYLTEAKIVSALDHPSIVPVYDWGYIEDGRCYVVSKYIDGGDLKSRLKNSPYSVTAAADLVATIADALQYAHSKGVIHRDVKPANILIDALGRPYLADFGLAMREQDFGKGNERAGTIAYMSVEQLRGEGHLVDGRSDIFSLGIVFYELITGKRPFPTNRLQTVSMPIESRPPRQIDDSISKELERICLKALAYRVTERYSTAGDMAAELRTYLQSNSSTSTPPPRVAGSSGSSQQGSSGHQTANSSIHIVPKGLRSFDRDDAQFFLELLPGPRGRDGLPESVAFWKKRIPSSDSESFRVGVIYGPSGSGKSSFLKAGVLPQLSPEIETLYVESTPLDTETRLLKVLRKSFPRLPPHEGLVASMTLLRRQHCGSQGRRLLIVLDQFEQWLHARTSSDSEELIMALRQCDGVHLQCLITIRDDFWMAVTHVMDDLEVTLVPGENLAVIDLFNIRHARRVLTAIGQAYGVLSMIPDEITSEQKAFIEKAIANLARNQQVIPVQLTLFAEMVKDKEWSTDTLKSLGGARGVGVRFLEETFNGRTASPHHRLHQKAARAVLQALLPEGNTGIKGGMRSWQELLKESGYAERPRDFEAMIRILDSELRLITPTDPEGLDSESGKTESATGQQERFYHLTHDYLVPSLQEWLTRKQKETRRGRAELILADLDSIWSRNPTNRSLPSFPEWLNILLFAGARSRRESRPILAASARYYGGRAIVCGCLFILGLWGAMQSVQMTRAISLVESLPTTQCQGIPKLIEALKPYQKIVNPRLQELVRTSDNPVARLYAAMALLDSDPEMQSPVFEGMLNATSEDFATIRDVLRTWGNHDTIVKELWAVLLDSGNDPDRRFRAGAALATFDRPDEASVSQNWNKTSEFLANRLVAGISRNSREFDPWLAAIRPARSVFYKDLFRIFSGPERSEIETYATAMILSDFAANEADKLVDLSLIARPQEYPILVAKLRETGEDGRNAIFAEFAAKIPEDATLTVRNQIKKRKAHAAVALLEFDITQPLMNVLSVSEDPTISSFAEDRLSKLGVYAETLYRLMTHADTDLRASLLRSLAGMSSKRFSPDFSETVVGTVSQYFQNDPDPGVHSAAEWALRSWGLKDQLVQSLNGLASDGPQYDRSWYVNHQRQTMIVFKGPILSRFGSPSTERYRDSDEQIVTRTIDRDFAICSTEVTVEQFLKFLPKFRHGERMDYTPTPDCPMVYMTWFRAAEYCNWLSKQEGIPEDQWCYSKQFKLVKTYLRPDGEQMETMQPEQDYLSRTGYRLVTEAEWEFACRAGSTTEFYWGSDREISTRYARTTTNSYGICSPVGTYCPNRYGLFDMLGNATEWLHDRYRDGIKDARSDNGTDQSEPQTDVLDDSPRVIRGGSVGEYIAYQRSANRSFAKARDGVGPRIGFRIGRTLSKAD